MKGSPPEGDAQSSLQLPRPADFVGALALLTHLPFAKPDTREAAFGRAATLFPLVGLLVGGVIVLVDDALGTYMPKLPTVLRGMTVVILWEWIARRPDRHTATPAKALVLAAAVLSAVKVAALWYLPPPRTMPLLFAPLLGAWSIVVLAVGARDAGTPGRKFAPTVMFNEFALASLFTFGIVFATARGLGVLTVVCAATVTLLLRVASHTRSSGISWTSVVLGASVVESAVLAVLAVVATVVAGTASQN